MRAFLQHHLDDLLLIAGGAVLVYATWQVNPLGAVFLIGVELIVLGVLVGLGGSR